MTYIGTAYTTAKRQSHYDAIIVGSGMGGLSAASVLAQKGRKVLVLEQHHTIGGCTHAYMRRGYEWNIGLHYIGDVHRESSMTYKLFDHVTQSGLQWDAMPDIYNRIMINGREYKFHQGKEHYVADLKRYFPDDHAAIDAYMDLLMKANRASTPFFAIKALPSAAFEASYDRQASAFLEFAKKTTWDVLSSLTTNQELIAVICGNYGDYSLPPKQSAFAMHAMLVRHYMDSASYPKGGAASIAKAVVPIIEEAGGQVLYNAKVADILLENDVAKGVRLQNGDEIRAGVVISNAGVNNTFGKMLPDSSAQKPALTENLQQVNQAYCAVGLNIGLKADADALKLHGANIWAHPGNDLDGNISRHAANFNEPFPWAFITFPSAKDSSWKDRFPGKATIEMFCATDYGHFEQWAGTEWQKRGDDYRKLKDRIADRMMGELFKYVPQIEPFIDYYEVSTPVSYERFLGRDRGNFMGVEASPARFQQKWLRAETPIKGLYLSGQDVVTDGIIGSLMGGVIASSAVLGENVVAEIGGQKLAGK